MSRKIFAAVLVLALSFVSEASLLYYTFDGTVDPASVVPSNTAVHYVFAVDFDQPASVQYADGTIDQFNKYDYSNSDYIVNYFYCNFIGTHLFPDVTPGNEDTYYLGYTLDYNSDYTNDFTQLNYVDSYNHVQIWQYTQLSSWQVGQTFRGFEFVSDFNGVTQTVYSDLTLSDINATAPGTSSTSVPEPGMTGMLAMGILSIGGIGALRRRKQGSE